MKASNLLVFILTLGLVVSLVFYVPMEIIKYVSSKALDPLFGGVIAVLSILAGATLGFFGFIFNVVIPSFASEEVVDRSLNVKLKEMEERMLIYRARQRAMLEELDEIKRQLEEIRNILREGMGV
ncbi:MAG: hypothetical protein ABWK01_01280 [Infirmifilum sp.]